MIVSNEMNKKTVNKTEVDAALDKIFSGITSALSKDERHKISLDRIDETLGALFDAINRASYEGKKTKIPDFKRILSGDN